MTSLDQVEQACRSLAAAGQPITFTAIADHTGLSRATLYRNQQLRAVIDDHRLRHNDARTLTGLTAEIAHLRTAVEAIADLAKRQDERIRRLERRNRQAG
jgi:DNA-binding IclR family transcriptional regulator